MSQPDTAPLGGMPAQERELRAQGRKTMRKLLDAGMTVFGKRGYHAARVDDIVKVARTSHGTFYLYFANKEDLFKALLGDVASEVATLAGELGPVGPGPDGRTELRAWLARFAELYERYGPVIRVWTEAELDDPEVQALGEQVLGSFAQAIATRAGDEKGVAALAAVAMVERVNYYVLIRRVKTDREQMLDTLAALIHVGVFGGTTVATPAAPAAPAAAPAPKKRTKRSGN